MEPKRITFLVSLLGIIAGFMCGKYDKAEFAVISPIMVLFKICVCIYMFILIEPRIILMHYSLYKQWLKTKQNTLFV